MLTLREPQGDIFKVHSFLPFGSLMMSSSGHIRMERQLKIHEFNLVLYF
jgi:hypothetical protein